jgi:hypothetical protein
VETEEMRPKWFAFADIPYATMWDDDKYWFPLFLEGKKFTGTFWFDRDGKKVLHQELELETSQ